MNDFNIYIYAIDTNNLAEYLKLHLVTYKCSVFKSNDLIIELP